VATWKHAERRIAAILHGHRFPVSGRGDQPDIDHPWLAVEVKHRRRLPLWLTGALEQAERVAKPDQLPVAVLHQHGRPYRDSLVVVRLKDFEAWFGSGGELP